MRIPSQLSYVLGGAAAFAILAGCSGAGTGTTNPPLSAGGGPAMNQSGSRRAAVFNISPLPPKFQSMAHPAAFASTHFGHAGTCPTAPVGFISDFNLGVVYELDKTGAVCATLTGFTSPSGLSTDKSGNLYVANEGANTIVELSEATGIVENTYQDPGEYPTGVCVDKSGNLAVTNIESTSSAAGNVVLYTAGATSGPTGSASASNYTSPRFCAFTQSGQIAFDDYDEFNTLAANVGAIMPGNFTGTKRIIPLTTSNTLTFPGGVQINSANKLVIDDQSASPPTLYTYQLSGTSLTVTASSPMSGSGDPVTFAFAPGSSLFLTADATLVAAQLYKYPAGGSAIKTATLPSGGLPIGAAINPTEQFTLR